MWGEPMSWQEDLLKLVSLAAQAKTLGDELADLASKVIRRVEVEAGPGADVEISIKENESG